MPCLYWQKQKRSAFTGFSMSALYPTQTDHRPKKAAAQDQSGVPKQIATYN